MSNDGETVFGGVVAAGMKDAVTPIVQALEANTKAVRQLVAEVKRGPVRATHRELSEYAVWMSVLDPYAAIAAIEAARATLRTYAETGSDEAHDALMAHSVELQGLTLAAIMAVLTQQQAQTGLLPTEAQMQAFAVQAGLVDQEPATSDGPAYEPADEPTEGVPATPRNDHE